MILRGPSATQVTPVLPVLVWTKPTWEDPWTWQPELRALGVRLASASDGASSATFARPYGWVKHPWETAVAWKSPWTGLAGLWVMVASAGEAGYQPIFIGRLEAETRQPHGADEGPSGVQTWQAVGPTSLLERRAISRSWWLEDGTERELQWVPDANRRGEHGLLLGNRSEDKSNGTYLFSGPATLDTGDVWSHYDLLEYVVERFLNAPEAGSGTGSGDIHWTIGGQVDLLAEILDVVPMDDTQTVADLLARLIPRTKGLDYLVNWTEEGFEIRVFSLNSLPWSFGWVTLHSNPQHVFFTAGECVENLGTSLATVTEEQYRTIRVLGNRLVICGSLVGDAVVMEAPAFSPHPNAGSLAPCWDAGLEAEYLAGKPGVEDPEWDSGSKGVIGWNREFRRQEKFAAVYQHYAMPIGWDMDAAGFAPLVKPNGDIAANGAPYQTYARQALDWLPLKEGYDYSNGETVPLDDESEEKDFLPPAVWVSNISALDEYDPGDMGYFPAEDCGISVSIAKTRLGVELSASPNHLLAMTHWTGASPSDVLPKYDYELLVATLAWESDQRWGFEVQLDNGRADGVKEILIEDAECWWLAPNTVVGVDENLALKFSGSSGRLLRCDLTPLVFAMAGALARYGSPRSRATIELAGLFPFGPLVGRILDYVESGGEAQAVAAPITSITWTIPQDERAMPRTTIHTGYAR
jgi:hypothetical protein